MARQRPRAARHPEHRGGRPAAARPGAPRPADGAERPRRRGRMPPAKAHPYMVSFGRLGLIEQDRNSGHYLLGPLALQLGLISLQQADPVHVATPLLPSSRSRSGRRWRIAVWGDRGATIVRATQSPAAVHVDMRHGTVFSLDQHRLGPPLRRATSTPRWSAPLIGSRARASSSAARRRRACRRAPLPDLEQFEAQLDDVRRHALSRSEGASCRRERDVGAGVRPPWRDRAGDHRDRAFGRARHALARADRAWIARCSTSGVGAARTSRDHRRTLKHKTASLSVGAARSPSAPRVSKKLRAPLRCGPNPRRDGSAL